MDLQASESESGFSLGRYTLMSVGGLLNVYFQVFKSHERLSTVVSTTVGNVMFFIVLFATCLKKGCGRTYASVAMWTIQNANYQLHCKFSDLGMPLL